MYPQQPVYLYIDHALCANFPLEKSSNTNLKILPAAATGEVLHNKSKLRAHRRSIFIPAGSLAPVTTFVTHGKQSQVSIEYAQFNN